MRHKPRNIALLSMLALLVAGVTASAASAAIQFEWKVNGSPLASGTSKPITTKVKSADPLYLQMSFGGATVEFSSSQVKFGSGANVIGGKPGTGEGSLILEGVKVVKPAGCGVKEVGIGEQAERITLPSLKREIVESAEEGGGSGKSEILLSPKVGTPENILTEFEITGTSCSLKGSVLEPKGTLLEEAGPQKTEAKIGQLTFDKMSNKNNEYRTSKNEYRKAKMEWAGNAANLTGETETELVSKEVFGAF